MAKTKLGLKIDRVKEDIEDIDREIDLVLLSEFPKDNNKAMVKVNNLRNEKKDKMDELADLYDELRRLKDG